MPSDLLFLGGPAITGVSEDESQFRCLRMQHLGRQQRRPKIEWTNYLSEKARLDPRLEHCVRILSGGIKCFDVYYEYNYCWQR